MKQQNMSKSEYGMASHRLKRRTKLHLRGIAALLALGPFGSLQATETVLPRPDDSVSEDARVIEAYIESIFRGEGEPLKDAYDGMTGEETVAEYAMALLPALDKILRIGEIECSAHVYREDGSVLSSHTGPRKLLLNQIAEPWISQVPEAESAIVEYWYPFEFSFPEELGEVASWKAAPRGIAYAREILFRIESIVSNVSPPAHILENWVPFKVAELPSYAVSLPKHVPSVELPDHRGTLYGTEDRSPKQFGTRGTWHSDLDRDSIHLASLRTSAVISPVRLSWPEKTERDTIRRVNLHYLTVEKASSLQMKPNAFVK